MTATAPSEIQLRAWATQNDVPYRTAIDMANKKKIPAKKKRKKVRVVQEKKVTGYYIMSNVTVPR